MSDRSLRLLRLVPLAAAALALLVLPSTAHAWGPLAHLHFSAQALAQLDGGSAPLRGLLQEFSHPFLYGSLAADIVIGKNLARYADHVHNWKNGFRVLSAARTHAERAFGWGFLAHLAADTVAHGYYVPWKTVASFHAPRTGHGYWELRYEQAMDPGLSRLARDVTHRRYRVHDLLLRETLASGCVLPFTLSRGLFASVLASARTPHFQRFSRVALAPRRLLALEKDLVSETNDLAVAAILDLLHHGERAATVRNDARGARNIAAAKALRQRLKRTARRGRAARVEAMAFAAEARHAFRHAIHGNLVLPAAVHRLAA